MPSTTEMNMTKIARSLLLLLVVLVGGGCGNGPATKALMRTVEDNRRENLPVNVKLVSAYRIEGDFARLCFDRSIGRVETKMFTALVPLAGNRNVSFPSDDGSANIIKIMNSEVKEVDFDGCVSTQSSRIPILETKDQDGLKLEANQSEAMYVRYSEDSLVAVGYFSGYWYSRTTGSRFNYAIDLSETDIYSKPGTKAPYLLMLKPVTEVFDFAVIYPVVMLMMVLPVNQFIRINKK
jgi:hypothetical protein